MGHFNTSNGNEKLFFMSLQNQCDNSCYMFSKIIMFFRENGYGIVSNINRSDIVVINTCAVTDRTIIYEEEILQRLMKKYKDKKFIIFGCLTKLSNKFDNGKNVLLIEPEKMCVLDEYFIGSKSIKQIDWHQLIGFLNYQLNVTDKDYFIRICQGCVNNCSYCNINLVKGYVTSKPMHEITKEVENAIKLGIFSITLLADDCGSYGIDIKTNIAELIDNIIKVNRKITLKIYSINPHFFIKHYPVFMRLIKAGRLSYICLPCQSGSQRILNLMNRKYDLNKIKKMVRQIKEISPGTHLCTHILYNFHTESRDDFKESLKLAGEFDFTVFLKFGENKRTQSAKINPKCNRQEGNVKMDLINRLIKKGIIKGVAIVN